MWRLSKPIGTILVLVSIFLFSRPAQAKYGGGSGTSEDPYRIATAADLIALGETPEDYDKHFVLTADIDLDPKLPGRKVFDKAVIAHSGAIFTGCFNGKNHTISNLTIDKIGTDNEDLGLFGYSAGEVRNLRVENVNLDGGDESYSLGGLVGQNSGTVINCYSTGIITGGAESEGLGGLVGEGDGRITKCYSACVVRVARNKKSYDLGGLVGHLYAGGSICDCYSMGDVTGGVDSEDTGGLVGENDGSISNCYSTGNATGARTVGGLVGYNEGGSINNCYYLVTSGPYNGLGTTLTDIQMKHQSSFLGWDFVGETANGTEDIWTINQGVSYPKFSQTKEFMVTFDDGPVLGKTDKIISALKDAKIIRDCEGKIVKRGPVKAGFFIVGDNDRSYHYGLENWPDKGSVKNNQGLVREVAEVGHLIGNHTQHHAYFRELNWYWSVPPVNFVCGIPIPPSPPLPFPLWWKMFGYRTMEDFVKAEIDAADHEIKDALGYSPDDKLFRVPYLECHPDIWKATKDRVIVWGEVVDTWGCDLDKTKQKALLTLRSWDKDEPRVLIFHDIHPVTYTYEHIRAILDYLQEKGFILVDFDPKIIPNQVGAPNQIGGGKLRQALSGLARSPVDLQITDPDGLILGKEQNQIPGGLYQEADLDGDGRLDDFFMIPEPKAGHYSIQVIPEPNVLPEDTYSLEASYGERVIVLAEHVPVREIPTESYLVTVIQDADLNSDAIVSFADFAILAEHWLVSDYCNQTNNWCSAADSNKSGMIDIVDLVFLAEQWLQGTQ
jgi:peptidoglycan/xylan/chitin deacetylase (PgdA/CDA1 family)